MIKIVKYSPEDLPQNLKDQIISFLNNQWPERSLGANNKQEFLVIKNFHPTHFVLTEGEKVISYAAVVWKILEHNGIIYKVYGLSGVFTKPEFRNKGYALKLIQNAKEFIEKTDGDIALFPSVLDGFYEKAEFIRLDNAKLLNGLQEKPTEVKENVFMLFISDKGMKARKDFEAIPIYFGKKLW